MIIGSRHLFALPSHFDLSNPSKPSQGIDDICTPCSSLARTKDSLQKVTADSYLYNNLRDKYSNLLEQRNPKQISTTVNCSMPTPWISLGHSMAPTMVGLEN